VAALEHYSICLASSNVTHNWQLAHGFSHRMTHTHTQKAAFSLTTSHSRHLSKTSSGLPIWWDVNTLRT